MIDSPTSNRKASVRVCAKRRTMSLTLCVRRARDEGHEELGMTENQEVRTEGGKKYNRTCFSFVQLGTNTRTTSFFGNRKW